MRISNQMTNQMLTNSILDNQSAIYRKQQQIAEGTTLLSAADDPAAWSRVQALQGRQAEIDQYTENAALAEARLLQSDLALSTVSDMLSEASELMVSGSDGTLAEADRQALGEQMDALLERLVSQANTQVDGLYLFGGVSSTSAPFEVSLDADGRIASVEYAGADFAASVEVADGDMIPSQLVGGGDDGVLINNDADAFAALIEARDQLLAGENLADTGLQERNDAAFEQVIVGRATVGACMEHVALAQSFLSNQDSAVQSMLSDLNGLDITEAVTELTEKQTAYEATLAMTSKAMNVSLLNYL